MSEKVPYLTEEEDYPPIRDAEDELEAVLFELHDNWPKYRGHAVPTILVDFVRELRRGRAGESA